MTASPRAPLCDMKPTRPRGGFAGPNVAFIETSGAMLITPMQLGPTSRMPASRQTASNSAWRLAPSSPDSANPEEITTRLLTPFFAHWRAVSTTPTAGTAITVRRLRLRRTRTVGHTHHSALWRAVSTTPTAGPAITARPTGPGISSTVGYATTDWTTGAEGLTGKAGPLKPLESKVGQ